MRGKTGGFMKFCQHCGRQLDDNAVICPQCGCAVPKASPAKRGTPYIVWSVLLIVICNPIAMILGIIALVNAVGIDSAPTQAESQKKLETARILCIVATCIDGVAIVGGVFGRIFTAFHMMPFWHFGRWF